MTSSEDFLIKIWDFNSQKCIKNLDNHLDIVYQSIYSKNERMIASCSEDKSVNIYYVFDGYKIQKLKGHVRGKFLYNKFLK